MYLKDTESKYLHKTIIESEYFVILPLESSSPPPDAAVATSLTPPVPGSPLSMAGTGEWSAQPALASCELAYLPHHMILTSIAEIFFIFITYPAKVERWYKQTI